MMLHVSVLAGALRNTNSAEKRGERQAPIRPHSRATLRLLTTMMKPGYAGKCGIIHDHCTVKVVESLTGRLCKCGETSPRFDVQLKNLEKWQNELSPSREFGFPVPTTSVVITDQEEAR